MVVRVPGRRDRPEGQPAGLVRSGDDREAEVALVLDVVRISVRPEDVARTDVPALGRLEEVERRSEST